MGERVYSINGYDLQFSDEDDTWRCLCTFPGNDVHSGADAKRVASLALLGAAVILAFDSDLEHGLLPTAVPQWIRDSILRAVGKGPSAAESWSPCDCDWGVNGVDSIQLCGCGEKHCRLYRDEVIHWRGQHWRIQCAFEKAASELSRPGPQ